MKEIEEEVWTAAKFIRSNGTILDFTGLYEVSDLGRVRSLNYNKTGNVKILKQQIYNHKDGTMMYRIMLFKNNKQYLLNTHRLILSSFRMNEYFPKAIAGHIDDRTKTKCNNKISNLHWITYSQNNSTEHHRVLQQETHINRKDQSKKVRVTFSDGTTEEYPSSHEAERVLGLSKSIVSYCIRKQKGFCKKHGLHFAYV